MSTTKVSSRTRRRIAAIQRHIETSPNPPVAAAIAHLQILHNMIRLVRGLTPEARWALLDCCEMALFNLGAHPPQVTGTEVQ